MSFSNAFCCCAHYLNYCLSVWLVVVVVPVVAVVIKAAVLTAAGEEAAAQLLVLLLLLLWLLLHVLVGVLFRYRHPEHRAPVFVHTLDASCMEINVM